MADLQTINIGNVVNDGLGDDLRTAFQKVNANFADLNAELTVTVTNTGTTGVGLFKEKVGSDLRFKKLVSGTKMLLDEQEDNIIVNNGTISEISQDEFSDVVPKEDFQIDNSEDCIKNMAVANLTYQLESEIEYEL